MFSVTCKKRLRTSSMLVQILHKQLSYQTARWLNTAPYQDIQLNYAWVRQRGVPRICLTEWKKPHITGPNDVLIKVKAASVNPMDVAMSERYGEKILDIYCKAKRLITLGAAASWHVPDFIGKTTSISVLGRDFSGVVEAVGHLVERFRPGDEVYGATDPTEEGSHSQYNVSSQHCMSLKPQNLSHIEAAAIPYAALTFLSAVNMYTKCKGRIHSKRVLLNGGAGGIGTFAIQYLKAMGCEVTVCVSRSGYDVISGLNADHILDYQSAVYEEELRKLAGFDVVFDFAGDESALSCIKPTGWYLTAVSPLLQATDDKGLVCGSLYASSLLARKVSQTLYDHGVYYSWVFFTPSSAALEEIKVLVESNQIHPIIDEVFAFEKTLEAYEKVSKGKGRGKVIINVDGADPATDN